MPCAYIVPRKNRPCPMVPRRGSLYCGQHIHLDPQNNEERVPCPYNPEDHTIERSKLKVHLRKCLFRPIHRDYFIENVNVQNQDFDDAIKKEIENDHDHGQVLKEKQEVMKEEDRKMMMKVIEIVRRVYKTHGRELRQDIRTHPVVSQKIDCQKFAKHPVQIGSLIGHITARLPPLSSNNTSEPDSICCVEWGAGRGELSYYLHHALSSSHPNLHQTYILIDRKSVRNKFDASIRHTLASSPSSSPSASSSDSSSDSSVHRLLIDIKDLSLPNLNPFSKAPMSIHFSKHLCGAATDLTLTALSKTISSKTIPKTVSDPQPQQTRTRPVLKPKIAGIVIAVCCHHRCSYETYPRDVLEAWGIGRREFQVMRSMTSWATCSRRRPTAISTGTSTSDSDSESQPSSFNKSQEGKESHEKQDEKEGHLSGLSHEEREVIGYQTKRVFDIGRKLSLERNGWEVDMVEYVPKQYSLENVAMVITRPHKSMQ